MNGLVPTLVAMLLGAPGPDGGSPGAARELAMNAIASARNAVAQAAGQGGDGGRGPGMDAQHHLEQAEALFARAQYPRAAQEADSAWKLLGRSAEDSTQFAVDVQDGRTQVRVRRGETVKVEAQGHIAPVKPGETVTVEAGRAPGHPVRRGEDAALAIPEPLKPAAEAKLAMQPDGSGLGSARVSWKPVEGALGYILELRPGSGPGRRAKSTRAETTLTGLAAGVYFWRVQAVGQYGSSELSAERSFELQVSPLKLEVKGSGWK